MDSECFSIHYQLTTINFPSIANYRLTAIVFEPLDRVVQRQFFRVAQSGQVEQAMAEDIEQKVIEIVSEQMGVDKGEITRETHFINDLNADSLDTVELVMEFEDEFELSIPDEEAEKIQTVGQAIDYIKEHSSK